MKKKLIIILSAVLLAAIAAVCFVIPLNQSMADTENGELLPSEAPLPAPPVVYDSLDYFMEFVSYEPPIIPDAETAAALAETIYEMHYARKGMQPYITSSVWYDEELGIWAVHLDDIEYAAGYRNGTTLSHLKMGGGITIYLNEKDGAVAGIQHDE